VLDQRGQLLRAALGFAGLPRPSYDRALWALRIWLDSWSGIGHIAVGMARQGYDLQLTRYDEKGWRATFYTTGMEHSPTSATGTGWDSTPWHATQRAAWDRFLTRSVRSRELPPLRLPDLEAVGVNLHGSSGSPSMARRHAVRDPRPQNSGRGEVDRWCRAPPSPLHEHVLVRQEHVAGVTGLPVARTAPDYREPVMGQATVTKLALDEKT
jgi:hypothetical protein